MKTALKREITSNRILDAAYQAIADRGWGAVTLREIAEESGVALSQLSYYFGNKDGLFAAVLERMQREYAENLAAKLRDATSLQERLEKLIDYNRLLLRENSDLYRNFLEFFNFAMASPEFKKQVTAFLTRISRAIEKQIAQKQQFKQKLDPYSSSAVTQFILSASFGISLQHLLAPKNKDVEAGFDIIKSALEIVFVDSKDLARTS
jgi:AcrR family transcriptional regulator